MTDGRSAWYNGNQAMRKGLDMMADGKKAWTYACDCGCGNAVSLVNAYGRLYASWMDGCHGSQQHPGRHGLGDRVRYLRGKRCLRDLVLAPGALEDLYGFLGGLEFDPEWVPEQPAYSKMEFDVDIDFGEPLYTMCLVGRLNAKGVLRGYYHRMFELDASPEQARAWRASVGDCLARGKGVVLP